MITQITTQPPESDFGWYMAITLALIVLVALVAIAVIVSGKRNEESTYDIWDKDDRPTHNTD